MGNLELWLVRHGETAASRDGVLAGWADVPLTPRGLAQAEAVRPALEGETFDGVWCSDLQRAVETARLAHGGARRDVRLREINFGELEGREWAIFDPEVRKSFVEFNGFHPTGGESLDQVRARVRGFLGELAPGRHLVFTHGGVIRLLTREAGHDVFVPTGTVVGLDWTDRAVLFTRESPVAVPQSFTE
ncbi:MAG: histidine phosphatase family protein [Thermoanaerobaculaceae bacterium]|jgi:probable phosphoglycerate mutase